MSTLITNIQQLVWVEEQHSNIQRVLGKDMNNIPSLYNAWLRINNGLIEDFGSMDTIQSSIGDTEVINAQDKIVLPAWVDSHTHLVFAATREQEFVDKINGMSYEDISKRGGGILNSAAKMKDIDENKLYDMSLERLEEAISLGTGAIEIKSGYGLSTASELKMLRVIKRLKELNKIPIKSSFLAAHSYPLEYRNNHKGYLKLIIDEMLPLVATEGLADYIDVFCEQGFFSVEETSCILEAGAKYGLKPKIHANQLYRSGGVQVGVRHHAISVDHLESMEQEEIDALLGSETIPTLLPGAAFFLAMHYQPARKLIDANLPVAIASDYNPGTCPCLNMNTILSIACTQLKITPNEAITAQTINGAAALELQHELGTIKIGKKANLILTKKVPSLNYLPYALGSNWIDRVLI
jgi:imidazolonepropionase